MVAGRYRLERQLGSGAMAVVIAARHLELDERVAIKLLHPQSMNHSDAVQRFTREAWATAKIKSEHVARVMDVGRLNNGTPFMVMEYLEGMDLGAMLRASGPLPIAQAVEFVMQACEGVAEAHALGIVHRDLKPSNLFCVRRSDGLLAAKVLDFGISKVTRPSGLVADLGATSQAISVGSPLYMSPEQMSSSTQVDTRTDIWALGVILQQLITGRLPFPSANLPELALKLATVPPEPLRATRADVPKGLEQIVARCLEKEREHRYASVAELALALAPFAPARALAHAERAQRVLLSAASHESTSSSELISTQTATRPWPARKPRLVRIALVGLVCAALAALAALLVPRSEQPAAIVQPAASSLPVPQVAPSVDVPKLAQGAHSVAGSPALSEMPQREPPRRELETPRKPNSVRAPRRNVVRDPQATELEDLGGRL